MKLYTDEMEEIEARWVQALEPVVLLNVCQGALLNYIGDLLGVTNSCILSVERRHIYLEYGMTFYREVVIRWGIIIPGEYGRLAESGNALALNTSER